MKSKRAIFLDRDGVINKNIEGGYVLDSSQLVYLTNIQKNLKKYKLAGFKLIIVSNQQCVGKGLLSENQLIKIHDTIQSDLDIRFDDIYYCPHLENENCNCRKPKSGMLIEAAEKNNINLLRSYFIGDSYSDVIAAKQVGVTPILFGDQNLDIFSSNSHDEIARFIGLKSLVLCGGRGLRLRPLTDNLPKPMIPLKGKPILEHITSYLSTQGLNELVIAVGYMGDAIVNYFGNQFQYINSGDVSILKRIKDAQPLLGNEFLVVYGDTIADVDIHSLFKFHIRNNAFVTLTTYPMKCPFGLVYSKEGRVIKFKEKPLLNHYMNIGFMLFNRAALDFASNTDDLIMLFQKLIDRGLLFEFRHTGRHITVNTEKEKEKAEKEIGYLYTYKGF